MIEVGSVVEFVPGLMEYSGGDPAPMVVVDIRDGYFHVHSITQNGRGSFFKWELRLATDLKHILAGRQWWEEFKAKK